MYLKLLNGTLDIFKFIIICWFELANVSWCFSRQEESVCRTISLCTGMQSSTLAGLLATQFLGSSHAVPAACSVVAMAIMGLTLASFWGNGSRIRDIPMLLSPQTCSNANSWERRTQSFTMNHSSVQIYSQSLAAEGGPIERWYGEYITEANFSDLWPWIAESCIAIEIKSRSQSW